MEKQIIRWSYLLGLACVIVALVWRAAGGLGWIATGLNMPGALMNYMTFYKAALLFLVVAIATGTYSSAMKG
jgi:hypothetical protein